MSTHSANATASLLQDARPSLAETLFGKIRRVWSALAEGKAAADHYESLVARGMTPGQAAQAVFSKHFGKR
ncbi:MAG TPA: hypothetical protein VG966_00285 [Hyphomicrobiaceae bacterium]|nr:hypothetical protein [Hyphomicrobiaceae bacterium]